MFRTHEELRTSQKCLHVVLTDVLTRSALTEYNSLFEANGIYKYHIRCMGLLSQPSQDWFCDEDCEIGSGIRWVRRQRN
jgi:hypothetical protein